MSDLISAWVDQDEMRRLADSLLSRPYGHEMSQLEVDFGSQFEGFASEVSRDPVPEPERAVASGEKPVSQPEVQSTPRSAEQPSPRQQELQAESVPHPSSPEAGVATSVGPSPSVVRSAVQFLKKAQADGKAGGVIRGNAKQAVSKPPVAPSKVSAVNVSHPSESEPRALHSPFRRVTEEEQESPNASGADLAATPTEAVPVGRLKRPPAPSGDEPILARVIQFGKWLKGPVGARNFFVSNAEGKILIDEVENPKLIQVAGSLAGASGETPEAEIGSLHVRIGEDSILEVVPTPSQFGTLILGLIVEHPLPEELIREVRLGLEEVANARLIKT